MTIPLISTVRTFAVSGIFISKATARLTVQVEITVTQITLIAASFFILPEFFQNVTFSVFHSKPQVFA